MFSSYLMKKNIFRPAWSFLDHLDESKVNQSFSYRVAQKKRPILFFIPKLCFTIFFPYFSGGVDSRPGRFFWHQYGSKLTLYFAGADKNHQGVLCRKISSSDTAAVQEIFGRKNVPDGRTIQRLVAKFRKTGSVADAHKDRDRSSFGIIPENIQNLRERHEDFPRKSTRHLSQETGISRTSVLRILDYELKLFPYKIQILQRQTDKNKVERETFCEDVSQRIENDPGLLDLKDLNDVDHCGLCGASATPPIFRNGPSNKASPTLPLCQKNWFCDKVRLDDFYPLLRSKLSSWIHIAV